MAFRAVLQYLINWPTKWACPVVDGEVRPRPTLQAGRGRGGGGGGGGSSWMSWMPYHLVIIVAYCLLQRAPVR